MKITSRHLFRLLIFTIVALWFGAFIPHYVSSRSQHFLGVLKKSIGGHLYVDATNNVEVDNSDISTISFLFYSNNGIGRAIQDITTQRIRITEVSNRAESRLGNYCGSMRVEEYTFFNLKLGDVKYNKFCA